MSGETPPTGSSRFQTMGKKYSNSSMSPGNNHSPNGGRGGHNRSRVLTSKVSAPRPINLPSLRRENASSSEWSSTASTAPTVSSGGGWGHSPSMSPFSLPQKWDSNTEAKHEWQNSNATASPEPHTSPAHSKSTTAPDSSSSSPPHPQASRAWATVSTTSTPTTSAEFPTATEIAPPEDDAVEKSPKTDKQQVEKNPESNKKLVTEETEHLDWDELVREDLEKEPSLDFAEDETVLPSDRFTEDYDRSYPPQIHQVTDDAAHSSSGFHRGHSRRDNAWGTWGTNNNNNSHNHERNGYSRSSSQERRPSGDRGAWSRRDQGGNSERGRSQTGRFGNRRPSHDRKPNFQPTVLQRPRRMSELSARSDRSSSREDSVEPHHHHHQQTSPTVLPAVSEGTSSGRPTELTAAQREVMLSAAERAKKRRDEEEAEYQAARERARKKAEALAALSESNSKPVKSEDKAPADDSKSKDQQASSSNDSKPAKSSQNKEPSPAISIEKPSSEDVKSSETVEAQETKEKATIPEKVATVRDVSPSSKSSSKSRKGADRRLDYDEDEDNRQWDNFVEGIRESKTVERKAVANSSASAWNAYATRLQESSESRMNAAIDKYAAERNLDPSLFDDMRQRDREPLRLSRNRDTGRRSNRDRDRRHNNRDEGRQRNSTSRRESAQELTPVEQQNVNFESWPALGQGASAGSEEKVPVGGEKDTFKKCTQDKTVDKSTSGQTVDSVDEKEEAVSDEAELSKGMSDSEHTGKDEAPSVDEKLAVSKGSFTAEHTDLSSETPDTVDQDGPTQEVPNKPSTEVDEPVPEMIEASESGSHISHTLPTPESEPLGRGNGLSSEAVFEHWTRAKRHDFLQKSKDPIFPKAIERLAELKPASLTFRTVHDDSRPSPPLTGSQSLMNEEYLDDKQQAASLLLGNPSLAHSAFATSSFEGELSPQLMPPMTTAAMSGRHNFPLLVYQVPYNSRTPFMPGTAAYGVSADNQPGMFIPTSPVQQPLQQHHHQQQPVMGVYLLPPQQMLPPWPGMPVNINNQRRRH